MLSIKYPKYITRLEIKSQILIGGGGGGGGCEFPYSIIMVRSYIVILLHIIEYYRYITDDEFIHKSTLRGCARKRVQQL